MVSQHITTNLFQVQVRVDDQSTYPHHMSTGFVSRGVDMGASAIYFEFVGIKITRNSCSCHVVKLGF